MSTARGGTNTSYRHPPRGHRRRRPAPTGCSRPPAPHPRRTRVEPSTTAQPHEPPHRTASAAHTVWRRRHRILDTAVILLLLAVAVSAYWPQ